MSNFRAGESAVLFLTGYLYTLFRPLQSLSGHLDTSSESEFLCLVLHLGNKAIELESAVAPQDRLLSIFSRTSALTTAEVGRLNAQTQSMIPLPCRFGLRIGTRQLSPTLNLHFSLQPPPVSKAGEPPSANQIADELASGKQ